MTDKLDFYDIMCDLVLGVLFVCWIPICFPMVIAAKGPKYPDAFAVIVLVALALFVGELIQTVASVIEPVLFKTFRGRPSDTILAGTVGDRYFSVGEAARIRAKLQAALGSPQQTDGALFRYAMQRSEAAGIGRAARFNSLYAYHRGLLVLVVMAAVLLFASIGWGAAGHWPRALQGGAIGTAVLLLLLFWHRTKQRGFYYAREVLLTAERVLDERAQQLQSVPAQETEHGP